MSLVSRLIELRGAPRQGGGRARSQSAVVSTPAIEPMRRRHLRAILAIEDQVYPRPWTVGIFHSELDGVARGDRHYVVARRGGRLVGYGGMLFAADEAHITNIAVDPSCQRQGIATRLMLDLIGQARSRAMRAMSLEVRVSNHGAQALYRAFGFEAAGIRPKYYENVDDAVIMWCHDIASPAYTELLAGHEARTRSRR